MGRNRKIARMEGMSYRRKADSEKRRGERNDREIREEREGW